MKIPALLDWHLGQLRMISSASKAVIAQHHFELCFILDIIIQISDIYISTRRRNYHVTSSVAFIHNRDHHPDDQTIHCSHFKYFRDSKSAFGSAD